MSVFGTSLPECSADALPGVDGSGHHTPGLSSTSSQPMATFLDAAGEASEQSRPRFAQEPEAAHGEATTDDAGTGSRPSPAYQYSSGPLPALENAASSLQGGLPDPSCPRSETPLSLISGHYYGHFEDEGGGVKLNLEGISGYGEDNGSQTGLTQPAQSPSSTTSGSHAWPQHPSGNSLVGINASEGHCETGGGSENGGGDHGGDDGGGDDDEERGDMEEREEEMGEGGSHWGGVALPEQAANVYNQPHNHGNISQPTLFEPPLGALGIAGSPEYENADYLFDGSHTYLHQDVEISGDHLASESLLPPPGGIATPGEATTNSYLDISGSSPSTVFFDGIGPGAFFGIGTEGQQISPSTFDVDQLLAGDTDPMDLDPTSIPPPPTLPNLNNLPQVVFPPHLQGITQQWLVNHPIEIFPAPGNGLFAFVASMDDDSQEWPGPQTGIDYEKNLSFSDFCRFVTLKFRDDPIEHSRYRMNLEYREVLNLPRQPDVTRDELDEQDPDYQGIPWKALEIERSRFRQLRTEKQKHSNYANLKPYPEPSRETRFLPINRNFFRFRKTCNAVSVKYTHFQLRNVISSISKNDLYYTDDSVVMRYDPHSNATVPVMDLRRHNRGDPIKITTLASEFGIIIAGGFYGEYAMKSLDTSLKSKPIEGLVTEDTNGITNHVHFYKPRSSGTPKAVFSSNDEKLRTLDCHRNKIISEYTLPWAINCSATSPDSRLRVVVGDATEVVIQAVDGGEHIHSLPGHQDFGFACAWSDDGHTIATGNQDKMVRVYDARNFKRALTVLDTDIAGARSVRFSPVGSGPRVLAFAEPADFVSIVDAVTWESRQRIEFFGEVGGIGFSPDGRDFYVANSDRMVGGLMQFERWKKGVSGYPDYDDVYGAGHIFGSPSPAPRRPGIASLRNINMEYLGIV